VILILAFSDTPKMKFSKTKLSVINTMNSLQSNYGYNGVQNVQLRLQMVFKMSTVSVHRLLQSTTLLITMQCGFEW